MLKAEFLDKLPDSLVELYSKEEAAILGDMARRISQYEYFIPAAQWQRLRLIESGTTHEEVLRALTALTGKSNDAITLLMKEAGMETVASDNAVYEKAGKTPKPFLSSPAVQAVYLAGYQNTKTLFRNLTRTTAYEASGLFGDVLDNVYMQVTSGAFDVNTAVRNAIKVLANNGLPAIRYPSGRTDNLEVAVRRAAITGINQTASKMQLALAADMDSEFVETSAHAGARPDHQAWQGQVFSLSGAKPDYEDFYLATGYGSVSGLCGANCRHSFSPFFPGISQSAYPKDLLDSYEEKKYTYNGRAMTEYDAQQKQRYIERTIRKWKRENIMAKAAGLDSKESAAALTKWQGIEKDFLAQTGLKQQRDRTVIAK